MRKSFEWITSAERNWISSPESSRQNLSKVIDDNCLQSSMKEIFVWRKMFICVIDFEGFFWAVEMEKCLGGRNVISVGKLSEIEG